jgi:regulatory protein
MLARRELSESQIRQRLARRGHAQDDIDSAVDRLKAERAIDDSRVAGAIARTETSLKRRGKRRVAQEMQRAGIAPAVARHAIDETFGELDESALIDAALSKRLRDGRAIADEKEFLRLYRYLMAQGFESDRVLSALSRRRGARPDQT